MDNVWVESGATVRDSVVASGAVIGADVVLEGAVVAENARIGAGVELTDGARVWPDVELPPSSIRFSSDR